MESEIHIPVLLHEIIEYLQCKKGKAYLDCTLGLAGHASAIASIACPGGTVVGIDRDAHSVSLARKKFSQYGDCVTCLYGNFVELDLLLGEQTKPAFDGILMDLGFSSMQIDQSERGFSLMRNGPLDMRMDTGQKLTAAEIVNKWPEETLGGILRDYGEERWWKRTAQVIVAERSKARIETTLHLREIVERAIPHRHLKHAIHPATRVFQALRIAVNNELVNLGNALPAALCYLKEGGRLAVISYHSLEDRIVKNFFRQNAKGCICPPDFPECRCGRKPVLRIVTRKVVTPGPDEIEKNPRARSAKLRVCEKLGLEAGRK